jgi:hypothetical protein
MRKIIATLVIVALMGPILGLADTAVDLTQVNVELFNLKSQIITLQQTISTLEINMTKVINENDLELSKHITSETDPLKQSTPNILVIGILVSSYFVFRGMDLMYRKIGGKLKKKEIAN